MSDGKAKAVRDFEATVTALEKRRKSKIFIIVHTTSPHHLCNPELWTTIENRNQFKGTDTIEILVHSPGGHANIAYKIARFLRGRSTRLNALVPLQAKSATTLLCLGADSIVMGELAELGPLDVQLGDELEKGKAYFSPLNEFKSMEYLRDYATEFLDFFSFLLFNRGMSIKQALHEAIPAVTGTRARRRDTHSSAPSEISAAGISQLTCPPNSDPNNRKIPVAPPNPPPPHPQPPNPPPNPPPPNPPPPNPPPPNPLPCC